MAAIQTDERNQVLVRNFLYLCGGSCETPFFGGPPGVQSNPQFFRMNCRSLKKYNQFCKK